MKIKAVRIQNLRSFKDETIDFGAYTCLVGPNGAGKSNVFCALNIFFGEDGHSQTDLRALEEEDFHNRDTSKPIRVTITFTDLNATAKEDLKAYVRHDQLVVTAVAEWNPEKGAAPVKQVGERLVMKAFAKYFEAEKAKASVPDLKTIFTELRTDHPGVAAAAAKDPMRAALQAFEEAHPELCELVESQDQFYGVSKGDYLLNRHLQWVFVPAVKDAADEHKEVKDSALGQLLARTVRTTVSFKEKLASIREEANKQYQAVLAENQTALDDLSSRLSEGLAEWSTPDAGMALVWHGDKDKSVQVAEPYAEIVATDGVFKGALTRFGHGLQRSYLLALLQLIAAGGSDGQPSTLILACEEPELFQHPPQARHLSEVLIDLSEQGNQIAVCTHSPLFVRGNAFEHVRLVRRDPATKSSFVTRSTATEIEGTLTALRGKPTPERESAIAKLDQELNPELNELFFAPYIVLVEGMEDVAFIKAHLIKHELMDQFRALGCHIIPAHKKSKIQRPIAILKKMSIPFYCIFDADGACEAKHRPTHEGENKVLLSLLGKEGVGPFPSDHYWGTGVTVWKSCITDTIRDEFGDAAWDKAMDKVRSENGFPAGIEKSAHFIPDFLEEAWAEGLSSPSMEKLVKAIIEDAKTKMGR